MTDPMLKYTGILLTPEQLGQLVSDITHKEFRDVNSDIHILVEAAGAVGWDMAGHVPKSNFWTTFVPPGSTRDEDIRFMIVSRAYNNPRDSLTSYEELPVAEKDKPIFAWLESRGFEEQQLMSQWTTLPNPKSDLPSMLEYERRKFDERRERRLAEAIAQRDAKNTLTS